MDFKEVRFLRDTIKPETGNSLYKTGQMAHFYANYAQALVDSGDAELTKERKEEALKAAPKPTRRKASTSKRRAVKK